MARITILVLITVLLSSLALAFAQNRSRICHLKLFFPHKAFTSPLSAPIQVKVPLRLSFPCDSDDQAVGIKQPLLLLAPGGLLRPRDYSRLVSRFVKRGFVVALPNYTQRDFRGMGPFFDQLYEFIDMTTMMGLRCPSELQLASTGMIASALLHLLVSDLRPDIRRSFSLLETVIFGHSNGGAAMGKLVDGQCATLGPSSGDIPTDALLFLRVLCDGFSSTSLDLEGLRIRGLVSFEGFDSPSRVQVMEDMFYVALHSPFGTELAEEAFSGTSFNKRLATVLVESGNHFGPNNFVSCSGNQTPICSRPQPPPQDMFRTTRKVQEDVLKTIAQVTKVAYIANAKGKNMGGLKRLMGKEGLLVSDVKVL